MSDTAASLRRKIASAGELESVVRTMKAMAAASIGQYENAVRSLEDYYRTVQLGLAACFRQVEPAGEKGRRRVRNWRRREATDETVVAGVERRRVVVHDDAGTRASRLGYHCQQDERTQQCDGPSATDESG